MRDGEASEILIEAAASAFRDRDPSGRIRSSPDWLDLSPEDRDRVFESIVESRRLEAALHPSGLSTTARAVVQRIPFLRQAPPEREE